MVDNVIQFPNKTKETEVSEDDIHFEIGSEYAKAVLAGLIMKIGTDFDKEEVIPMGVMVYEAITAYYLKTKGVYHPFHEIADDLFEFLEE
jgi:DNA polymerase III epsilon subunit-like protein